MRVAVAEIEVALQGSKFVCTPRFYFKLGMFARLYIML